MEKNDFVSLPLKEVLPLIRPVKITAQKKFYVSTTMHYFIALFYNDDG